MVFFVKRKEINWKILLVLAVVVIGGGVGIYKFVTRDTTPKGQVVKRVEDSSAVQSSSAGDTQEGSSSNLSSTVHSSSSSSSSSDSSSTSEGSSESTPAGQSSSKNETFESVDFGVDGANGRELPMGDDLEKLKKEMDRRIRTIIEREFDYLSSSKDNPFAKTDREVPDSYGLTNFFVEEDVAYYLALLLNVSTTSGSIQHGDAGSKTSPEKAPKVGDKYVLTSEPKIEWFTPNSANTLLRGRVTFDYTAGTFPYQGKVAISVSPKAQIVSVDVVQ